MDLKFEQGLESIPEHMREGLRRWVYDGIMPGSFMRAVLCNDLRKAFGYADEINQLRLFDIVRFLHNIAPSMCWGSLERMNSWKGLNNLQKGT